MVGAQRPLANCQRSSVERLGLGVVALRLMEECQGVERCADIGVVGAQRIFGYIEGSPCDWFGLSVAALRVVEQG